MLFRSSNLLIIVFSISDSVLLSLKVPFESYSVFPFSHVYAVLGILMHMYNICNSCFKIFAHNSIASVISVLVYQLMFPTLFVLGPIFLLFKPGNFCYNSGYCEACFFFFPVLLRVRFCCIGLSGGFCSGT